jgi:type 1 glutamine amidotransferase
MGLNCLSPPPLYQPVSSLEQQQRFGMITIEKSLGFNKPVTWFNKIKNTFFCSLRHSLEGHHAHVTSIMADIILKTARSLTNSYVVV